MYVIGDPRTTIAKYHGPFVKPTVEPVGCEEPKDEGLDNDCK